MANPDLAVLRQDRQLPTHITPRILVYAQGYFREDLLVIGAKPPPQEPRLSQQDSRKRVLELLKKRMKKPRIELIKTSRRGVRYAELKADGLTYRVSLFYFSLGFLVSHYFLSAGRLHIDASRP